MARSVLGSFVSGTRAVLAVQVFVGVAAVALSGWTLSVTNSVIRERDRLRERVIQLEETMAARGIVVPSAPAVVQTPARDRVDEYPPPAAATEAAATPADPSAADSAAPAPADAAPAAQEDARGIGDVIGDAFGPTPPLRRVVLHVRSEADEPLARRMALLLQQTQHMDVAVRVMPPRDPRQSGYAYFDGRQSRAASDLVTRFHDIARNAQIAPWSAQLRGIALPAQGEYTPDRIDIVLPALPAAAAPEPRAVVQPRP